MRIKMRLAVLLAIVGSATIGCSDASNPAAAPGSDPLPFAPQAFFDLAPAPGMDVLHRTTPLESDLSTTKQIGADGGWLNLPGAGIHVYVPGGALDEWTTITLTAFAGDRVAFEFGPHGITFAKSLGILVRAAGTEVEYLNDTTPCENADGSLCDLLGVYYLGDGATGGVTTLETFPVFYLNGYLGFWTDHFSGYALAT